MVTTGTGDEDEPWCSHCACAVPHALGEPKPIHAGQDDPIEKMGVYILALGLGLLTLLAALYAEFL